VHGLVVGVHIQSTDNRGSPRLAYPVHGRGVDTAVTPLVNWDNPMNNPTLDIDDERIELPPAADLPPFGTPYHPISLPNSDIDVRVGDVFVKHRSPPLICIVVDLGEEDFITFTPDDGDGRARYLIQGENPAVHGGRESDMLRTLTTRDSRPNTHHDQ
jgi:hypothetical protein